MPGSVLLIAAGCYPSNAPGAHRPVKLGKYLREFGWTPVMVCGTCTPSDDPRRYDPGLALLEDVFRTVRVPYRAAPAGRVGRAARRAATAVFPYGTPRRAVRSFHEEALRLAVSEAVDVVWSTYLPGFPHLVARRISGELGVPWVADFRDLPDQTYNSWAARRSVGYEVSVCADASALVATSLPLARRLEARHRTPVHVVMNGFDPEDYGPSPLPGDRFSIRFWGTLYQYRDPRPLFRGIDLLHEAGEIDLDRVAVEFFGPPERLVRGLARGFACARVVRAPGSVPYGEMLRAQQESTVLLLLTSSAAGGAIPSRLFLCLGAGRPILNVPGDRAEVDRILTDTSGGVSAATAEEIARVIGGWYGEWLSTGALECTSVAERVDQHRFRERSRELAKVLDAVA